MSKTSGERQLQLLLPINNVRVDVKQPVQIAPPVPKVTYSQVLDSLRLKGLTKPTSPRER